MNFNDYRAEDLPKENRSKEERARDTQRQFTTTDALWLCLIIAAAICSYTAGHKLGAMLSNAFCQEGRDHR